MKKTILAFILLLALVLLCSCSVKNDSNAIAKNNNDVKQYAYSPQNSGQYLISNTERTVAEHGETMNFSYTVSDTLDVSSIAYSYTATNSDILLSFSKTDNYNFTASINAPITGKFKIEIICSVTLEDDTEMTLQDTLYVYAREDFDFASVASVADAKFYCYVYLTNPDEPSFEGYYAFFEQDSGNNDSLDNTNVDMNTDNLSPDDDSQADIMSLPDVTIHGHITWLDHDNGVHDAKSIEVEIVNHNGSIDTLITTTTTDENGLYSVTVSNSDLFDAGGKDFKIRVCSKGGSIEVVNNWSSVYKIVTDPVINFSGTDLQMDYQIDANYFLEDEHKEFAYAFRIHQAMYLGACYVETLEGSKLPTIKVYYPTVTGNSMYDNLLGDRIHILDADRDDWDVLLHEYGHYVAYSNNAARQVGLILQHQGPCENTSKGKNAGMPFAWSEGLATYFSISSQLEMNALSYGIENAGDEIFSNTLGFDENGNSVSDYGYYHLEESYMSFTSAPDTQFPFLFGESNEFVVAAVLLDLADNTPDEDSVNLGFTYIWNLIIENECQDLSEFINALYANHTQSSRLAFGEILSASQVSPLLLSPANEASDNWLIPSFNWTPQGGEVTDTKNYENNLFSLAFFDNNNNLILETPEITNAYYTPTNAEWTQIVNSGGSYVLWCVKAKQTSDDYVTGWYYSNHHKLNLSTPSTLTLSSNITGYVDESYYSNWYKFVAPYGGIFSFETTGLSDPYGELFSTVVYGQSFLNRLENGYDDNSGEGYNFKIEYELTAGQVVYVRVRDIDWAAVGTYNLTVTCISHEHEYKYVPLNDQYHIRQCACGVTYGVQSIHTVDTSVPGKFKPCIQCGIRVNTSGGVIVPGITGIPRGEIPYIPTVDNGAKNEEEPTDN